MLRTITTVSGPAITDSFYNHKGLTIPVEIRRQGGKNELTSQIEHSC